MRDFLFNELKVGDFVAHLVERGHGHLELGMVLEIKPATKEYVTQAKIVKLDWYTMIRQDKPAWVYVTNNLVKVQDVPDEFRFALRRLT
jgi:hypothetical protein